MQSRELEIEMEVVEKKVVLVSNSLERREVESRDCASEFCLDASKFPSELVYIYIQ